MAKDSDAYEFCNDLFANDNSTAHCPCFESWNQLDLSSDSYSCTMEVDGSQMAARDWVEHSAEECKDSVRRRYVIGDSVQRPCDEYVWDDWLEDLRESDKAGVTLDAEELCAAFLDGTRAEDARCKCFEEWVRVDLTRDLYACKLLGVMDLTGKEFIESQANVC